MSKCNIKKWVLLLILIRTSARKLKTMMILKKMKILMWMKSMMSMILILRMIPITRKRTRITTRNEHSKSK